MRDSVHQNQEVKSDVASALREQASFPEAGPSTIVNVPPGGAFDLKVQPVSKRIGDATFRMLSYNGSIPGPTLRVRQGSRIAVNVVNATEMETTVH